MQQIVKDVTSNETFATLVKKDTVGANKITA